MIKMSLFCLIAAIPFYASASGQNDEETVLCKGSDDTTIVLELWKPSQFGVVQHCLQASFSAEMMACAPHGGWGLGSDNDMTELVDLTNDWNTAHNHETGKVIASAGKRGVHFIAHAGKGIASNLIYKWKFAFERSTGRATWYANDGSKVSYNCEVSR
jgi:hypothetical protein